MSSKRPRIQVQVRLETAFSFHNVPEKLQEALEEFEAIEDTDKMRERILSYFGMAMFHGQTLEQGLKLALIYIQWHNSNRCIDQMDAYEAKLKKNTLGVLINSASKHVTIDESASKLLRVACRKRNFLAHEFFQKRTSWVVHPVGLRYMAVELLRAAHMFMAADEVFEPILQIFPMFDSVLSNDLERMTLEIISEAIEQLGS